MATLLHHGLIVALHFDVLCSASRRSDVIQAMQTFYAETDCLIAQKAATCWNRGKCCQFGRFGHRLYVTALEVCYYLEQFSKSYSEPRAWARANPRDDRTPIASCARHATTGIALDGPARPGGTDQSGAHKRRVDKAHARACHSGAQHKIAPTHPPGEGAPVTVTDDACPHAYGGRCHVRSRRPLGCRIFYCDLAAQEWQGPLTEDRLTRLRVLHDELKVPYFYAEWMIVLRALHSSKDVRTMPGETGL